MRRCDELGAISDQSGRLTRAFHSPAMQRANQLVGSWMRAAGLKVREDAAFNLLGIWPSARRNAKTLLLGSHLDTVPDAGKYDGPLGVLTAIAAVEHLRATGATLPFNLEVVGFSDEEGVRYQTAYLGSGAFTGTLRKIDLTRIEEKGIMRARRSKKEFLGFCEVHIEQGPVLEQANRPLGVVSGIAGQSRLHVEFHGRAGHAGTVPMDLRRDALAGAAELILAVERCGVQATVGQIYAAPGASNVIPGYVTLSIDVRDMEDGRRISAIKTLRQKAKQIATRRGLRLIWKMVQETSAVWCDKEMTEVLESCVRRNGIDCASLPSGAGHDAAVLAKICPVAMLFVRCKDGISHHPAESVKPSDVADAIGVLANFVETLGARHA